MPIKLEFPHHKNKNNNIRVIEMLCALKEVTTRSAHQNTWPLARAQQLSIAFSSLSLRLCRSKFFSVLFSPLFGSRLPHPQNCSLNQTLSPRLLPGLLAQGSLCTQGFLLARSLVKSLWGSCRVYLQDQRQRWKSRRILGNQYIMYKWQREMDSRTASQWVWSLWLE